MPLLAKTNPNEDLLDHLLQTLNCAREILAKRRFDNKTKNAALIAAALHDIGKADAAFQQGMLTAGEEQTKRQRLVPHALLGLPIAQKIIHGNLDELLESLILLAIASHHSPLSYRLYDSYDAGFQFQPTQGDDLKNTLKEICSQLNLEDRKAHAGPFEGPKNILVKARNTVTTWDPYSQKAGRWKREAFVAIQGVLEQADWLASSKKKILHLVFPPDFVQAPARPYAYQKKARQIKGNLFIALPTGSGKTEAGLYWAAANSVGPHGRVFYVLPTTTTINSMFLRLRGLWTDPASVALYHSYADLFFEGDSGLIEDDSSLQFFKYFFNPVNVTTPDQLILALLNHKRYTLKSFPLRNANVIVDEIHCYDPEMFGLVKGMIRYLSQYYKVQFCIMSATFPRMLKEELRFLNATNLQSDSRTRDMYHCRHRTQLLWQEGQLEDQLNQLENTKERCLVVLNTVETAQRIFRTVKELVQNPNDVMLIHGRYTFKDRRSKEARLTRPNPLPRILVATQIVEVSLDISYDQMLTQACDPLSLVQRAGRVNRRAEQERPAPIRVFKPPTHHPYDPQVMSKAETMLREKSRKIKSELDYLQLADRFYDEIWPIIRSEDAEERYATVWDALRYVYSADLSDTDIQRLLETRSGVLSVPAIPIQFRPMIDEINTKIVQCQSAKERMRCYREKRRYHVNVPITQQTRGKLVRSGNDQYVKMKYDEEYGLH